MRIDWRRQHKWSSLTIMVFMILLCLSGLVLNHREVFSGMDVSRSVLPPFYRYEHWNQGLMRGTQRVGEDSVLIFGTGGLWLADDDARKVSDANAGIPRPAHFRNFRAVVRMDSAIYALSTEGLYKTERVGEIWRRVPLPDEGEAVYTDMISRGDTLVVMSRSDVYILAPGSEVRRIELQAPQGKDISETTLFRTVWMLHKGELFGWVGKLVVDALAVVLIVLCFTGIAIFLLPKRIRRTKGQPEHVRALAKKLKKRISLHRKLGVYTIVLTALLCLTGWSMRPPLLIALARTRVPVIAGTALDTPNPWNDRLRMIRYDDGRGKWMFSTSEGFFEADSLTGVPHYIATAPPVSVMGLNVWRKDARGRWLCGSFSGMYVWDMQSGEVTDYFTGRKAVNVSGAPFGKTPVAGFSDDLGVGNVIVTFDDGCDVPQPDRMRTLPMSLWNVALEVHTGRIYIGNAATYFLIFVIGGIALWCLLSGWKVARSKRK